MQFFQIQGDEYGPRGYAGIYENDQGLHFTGWATLDVADALLQAVPPELVAFAESHRASVAG